MALTKVGVCGVPVRVSRCPVPGTDGRVVSHWDLSKPDARRLVQGIYGPSQNMPRPGKSIPLCHSQHLFNMSGSFQIHRTDGKDTLQGAGRKRR